ncbi:MAG: nucleoside triphosphate pyrophosphohydrolase [Treponema sp.]|nr:nucleoside triphosphate pyrophosphohydrolase [Treponema sp.]
MQQAQNAFKSLYDVVTRLRAPDGCPWDREQTPASLRGDLVEETYECIEAIDEKNPAHIQEELGDIFLLATMISYMHEEEGLFSVADVLQTVSEKLIRRHPHVFPPSGESSSAALSSASALSSAEVLANWAKIKIEQEGRKPKDSILDEVSAGMPPLDRAWKLQKKAAKAGFDWPNVEGVIEKIKEELDEVMAESNKDSIEEELGDLLFSAVNLCRYLKVEPSVALHRTNNKFINRFKYVEKRMRETGQEMTQENLAIMDQYWNEAKK